ncbi:D-alanyl-D-alanine carboxypeptidase family protein [Gordonia sp. FQ]|uniref:D-alanyl-D-alanine carboxypeptidase family protein n=1 Tax=Gordonia sp. FQ TaxID=3446634 RepID=UPI003F83E072
MRLHHVFRSLPALVAAAMIAGSVPLTAPAAAAPGDASSVVPTGSPAATTTPAPDQSCPHRATPPPAVDDSETVAPGDTTPAPLPVPAAPVGGNRLGDCGVIADPAAGPTPADLTSQGWLIADLDSGHIIATQDPHGRFRPASTIKTLLALVALEDLDLNKPVEANARDWSMEGDACGVGPGGKYTIRDIVTGLLVVSGNDCANILARELGGYDETLAKMNAKAKSLGALDTRAASPSGLDAAGMSTSPYDLAVIFRAGMRNPEFAKLVSTKTYEFPGYPPRKDVPGDENHPAYLMQNSNSLLVQGVPGMTILGGKTGYTDDAKKTFVGAAERDGRKILIVQMYGLTEGTNTYHDQAVRMFEYGFAAPASVSVGTLDNPAAQHAHLTATQTRETPSGSDSLALGVLPAVLIIVVVLAGAALLVFAVRRHRRRASVPGDDTTGSEQ